MGNSIKNDFVCRSLGSRDGVLPRISIEQDVQLRNLGDPAAIGFPIQLDREFHIMKLPQASLPLYCLITVPSLRRTSPQPPLSLFRSSDSKLPYGYFAASFSSTSIPQPGASLA